MVPLLKISETATMYLLQRQDSHRSSQGWTNTGNEDWEQVNNIHMSSTGKKRKSGLFYPVWSTWGLEQIFSTQLQKIQENVVPIMWVLIMWVHVPGNEDHFKDIVLFHHFRAYNILKCSPCFLWNLPRVPMLRHFVMQMWNSECTLCFSAVPRIPSMMTFSFATPERPQNSVR